MCLNHDLCVFWVSSLAYPNSLRTKGFVVVVIVVDQVPLYVFHPFKLHKELMLLC